MRTRGDQLAIACQRRMARWGGEQARGACLPFGRMLGVAGMQVILAAAGMGVDEQQALVLARQRTQDFQQQDVLVDVGEVAGMILVTILHETFCACRAVYTLSRGGAKTMPENATVAHVGAA